MAKVLAKDLAEMGVRFDCPSCLSRYHQWRPIATTARMSRKQEKLLWQSRLRFYVIVQLPGAISPGYTERVAGCWMGRRRELNNSHGFVELPARLSYTPWR